MCVLIHRVKGVVLKGVTLTHTVSYCPGETVFIKQQPGSNTYLNTAHNRAERIRLPGESHIQKYNQLALVLFLFADF